MFKIYLHGINNATFLTLDKKVTLVALEQDPIVYYNEIIITLLILFKLSLLKGHIFFTFFELDS